MLFRKLPYILAYKSRNFGQILNFFFQFDLSAGHKNIQYLCNDNYNLLLGTRRRRGEVIGLAKILIKNRILKTIN